MINVKMDLYVILILRNASVMWISMRDALKGPFVELHPMYSVPPLDVCPRVIVM
jgi:hypothetical protein